MTVPPGLGWSVLALVFLDELLRDGCAGRLGRRRGRLAAGRARRAAGVTVWFLFASPKATYGGPGRAPASPRCWSWSPPWSASLPSATRLGRRPRGVLGRRQPRRAAPRHPPAAGAGPGRLRRLVGPSGNGARVTASAPTGEPVAALGEEREQVLADLVDREGAAEGRVPVVVLRAAATTGRRTRRGRRGSRRRPRRRS